MDNKELSKYVHEQLQQGRTEEDIRKELLQTGWYVQDVNKVFKAVAPQEQHTSHAPKPPYTTAITTGKRMLDPRSIWVSIYGGVIFSIFLTMIIGFVSTGLFSDDDKPAGEWITTWALVVGGCFIVLLTWQIISALLYYKFFRYELTEEGFRKEYGFISKGYVTIPYGRIQNVDIHRSWIMRLMGTSNLLIQTAGSTGISSEGKLPGVSQKDAEDLRNELIHLSLRARHER